MSDFQFLKNPVTGKWVIKAPHRSHRPDSEHHEKKLCPFCSGQEADDEVYLIQNTQDAGWLVRVVANKFPFTPHHEVIIHSPDHHKSFDTLPQHQTELILKTYRARYNTHAAQGQVYIFHNHGHEAGESLNHPHSQLTVVPIEVPLAIPTLASVFSYKRAYKEEIGGFTQKWWGIVEESHEPDGLVHHDDAIESEHFYLFCPDTSEWPDEVWVAPKKPGERFGMISDVVITDMAFVLARLIQLLDLRHGQEFPFNFYIYPGENWYLRLVPRMKVLGGFEIGTGIIVNTQEPKKTFEFLKEHFREPNVEKIKTHHQAEYRKKV